MILAALLALSVSAQAPEVGPSEPVSAEALMRLDQAVLDALYAKAAPGPIPDGEAKGIANSDPGSGWGGFTRGFFRGLWDGKTFDAAKGELVNRTALGTTGTAKVTLGTSRIDGRPSIIVDYRQSDNLLARGVKDELRMIAPGLYLGVAYLKFPPLVGKYEKWLYFALQFEPTAP